MSGHSRKYKIMLTNEERNQLKEVLRSNKTCNTIKKRCQILLALDCNTNPDTTYRNCAYYLGVSLKMVCNIVKLYCESGLQRTLTLNRNVNSDHATRKIDGAMEARIIAMACGAPPEGYARWTIKLLTDHARVELGLTAGEEAVRRMLKNTLRPHLKGYWCIPKKQDADLLLAWKTSSTYMSVLMHASGLWSAWMRSLYSSSAKSVSRFLCALVLSRKSMQNTSAMEPAVSLLL